MVSDLTTPERVRGRMIQTDAQLTTQDIQIYIDDVTSYIQRVARTTFTTTHPLYELARTAATDLAAAYCIIRPAGGSIDGLNYSIDELKVNTSEQVKAKLNSAEKYIKFAEKYIEELKDDDTDYPQSNTGAYG